MYIFVELDKPSAKSGQLAFVWQFLRQYKPVHVSDWTRHWRSEVGGVTSLSLGGCPKFNSVGLSI